MEVVIVAGGTGGHFYPGFAVAEDLKEKESHVRFVVRKNDAVIPILERGKIPFQTIHAAGFKRGFYLSNILAGIKVVFGFFESLIFLIQRRPDVVLSMGGYLSFPPALAAKILKIPVVLHEQNVMPGLANLLVGQLAQKIAVSHSESRPSFRQPVVVTGNPIRREFRHLPNKREARQGWGLDPNKTTLLVFGGSLGAHTLNQWLMESLTPLKSYAGKVQILHFTGQKEEALVKGVIDQTPFINFVSGYCHDMPAAYAACDFVVCRSGASTVWELMAVKKPACLIPYPFATDQHQVANARVLVEWGVAVMAQEADFKQGQFATFLERFLKDPSLLEKMEKNFDQIPMDPFQASMNLARLICEVGA